MALLRWSVGRLLIPTFSRRLNQGVVSYSTQEEDFGERLTGVERRERDALMQNVTDPFSMEIPESTGGTKDSPLMVPSMFDERIVGCMCNRYHHGHYWFVLKKGAPQRCLCGSYFQLTEGPASKVY